MTPANVRAAAVWINRETEWRANNWTADCPAWSTTGHWGLYCRTNSDECSNGECFEGWHGPTGDDAREESE